MASGEGTASTSARGLFRATGKTSKPVAVRLLDGSIGKAAALERNADDFYPTPIEPTRALLHAEAARLADFPTIWEAACGDGRMAREIEAGGFGVIRTDIVDRGCGADLVDFLAVRNAPARAMVTNPPYNLINWRDGQGAWLKHGWETLQLDYMALLLSWSWPGAAGLGPLWARCPPARAYLMQWKIDFTGQGSPPSHSGWFVWDRAHKGETVLRMMDRMDGRQGEMFPPQAALSAVGETYQPQAARSAVGEMTT